MIEPIYSSQKHKALIDLYINMCKEFAKDVSSKTKYDNYLDVLKIISKVCKTDIFKVEVI